MSYDGLRGKALTLTQDSRRWTDTKLGGRNYPRRIVRLLSDQERRILPTKIGLRTGGTSGRNDHPRGPGHDADCSQPNEGRLFMKINLDSPSPTAYSPSPNPPNMTNSPSYTMRPKTHPEKDGGDRVSWAKEWFTNCDRWSLRVNFNAEHTWPSPTDHVPKPTIGRPQIIFPQSPSHSMQGRREFTLVSRDARSFPGPCAYDRSRSQNKILTTSPKFSIQEGRRKGTFPYIGNGSSLGPGSYNPNVYKTSQKVRRPAFTISKSPRIIGITRNCTF